MVLIHLTHCSWSPPIVHMVSSVAAIGADRGMLPIMLATKSVPSQRATAAMDIVASPVETNGRCDCRPLRLGAIIGAAFRWASSRKGESVHFSACHFRLAAPTPSAVGHVRQQQH